jgi:purine-binding chemotaxis protein CheW
MEMLTTGETSQLHLIFLLNDHTYGLPVIAVREIIPMVEITPLPNAPTVITGIINLRGIIVPIIDLRRKLALPERAPDARTCLVVAESLVRPFGFIADRVTDCQDIRVIPQAHSAPPGPESPPAAYDVGHLDGRIVILLDPEKLLSETDLDYLRRM